MLSINLALVDGLKPFTTELCHALLKVQGQGDAATPRRNAIGQEVFCNSFGLFVREAATISYEEYKRIATTTQFTPNGSDMFPAIVFSENYFKAANELQLAPVVQ